MHSSDNAMPQTLTIRNVPDALARKLKAHAEQNHRSLQGEVMAILVQAATGNIAARTTATYRVNTTTPAQDQSPKAPRQTERQPNEAGSKQKLSIEALWERGKRLGLAGPNESARIVRKLRDERRGR